MNAKEALSMSKPRPGRPEHAPSTRHKPDEASIGLATPEPMEGNALLTHPDVQVMEQGERSYRIRVGAVELTYDCSSGHPAWYLYLPGHKQHVGPVTTDQYEPGQQHCMINIDRDQRGRTFGIEVL
jgi:hypothetical protein